MACRSIVEMRQRDHPQRAVQRTLFQGGVSNDTGTLSAENSEGAFAILERDRVDLVIADMNFSADTTSGDEGAASAEIQNDGVHAPIV